MPKLVFWVDVDNTLLDNDQAKKEEDQFLQTELGPELAKRYWDTYEEVRKERGVVDIPLTLTRFRERIPESEMSEETYRHIRSMFLNFPFQKVLFPHALETLHYLNTLGTVAIVSDGDLTYQALKIVNSTLANAVDGRVLLYNHKQEHLEEIIKSWPADHYVMIDDKPDILVDMHKLLGNKVTTVFVRQGKYAKAGFPNGFTPDIIVDHIGDLRSVTVQQFLGQTSPSAS
jgi:FMN phosphatase YigB (HAD superfamily)